MPFRKVRFAKDHFYHLFSRGDRKEPIFLEKTNYQRFLEKLEEYRRKYKIAIICYCLLSNHFHLLVKQLTKMSLSRFGGTLLNSHARYLAVKYQLPTGHVFQGQFGAQLIETEESLLQTSRYIHLNPIKDALLHRSIYRRRSDPLRDQKLIRKLREYPWSSYPFYLQRSLPCPLSLATSYIFDYEKTPRNYKRFVEAKLDLEEANLLEDF